MPCSDDQSRYYEELNRDAYTKKAKEYGMIAEFLCTLCESIPAHQLLSIRHQSSQKTLAHWYAAHLFEDFQINPCNATREKLGRESVRIAEGLK